jgi:hypothetical protein
LAYFQARIWNLEPLTFELVHPSLSKIKIKIRFEDRISLVPTLKTKGNTYSDGPYRKIYSAALGIEV